MIVWRGWGILALIFPMILFGIAMASTKANTIAGGAGMLVGAAGAYVFGDWINKKRPVAKLTDFVEQRTVQLHSYADQGTFSLGPGHAQPTSLAEAHQQADWLVNQEAEQLTKVAYNRHTVFWIPMQWVAMAPTVGGVVLVISGIITSL
jgi:hypothetical protein